MTIRKADWIFGAAVVAVVAGVALLPSPRERNPKIPPDGIHRAIIGEPACIGCHAPGQARPLSGRHPKRQDCLRCHARAATS
jgi:hypothetical protein